MKVFTMRTEAAGFQLRTAKRCFVKYRSLMCRTSTVSVLLIFTVVALIIVYVARNNKIITVQDAKTKDEEERSLSPLPTNDTVCPCILRSIRSDRLRLSDLSLDDPYEGGSSLDALGRRHPNLGSAILDWTDHQCTILPFLTEWQWDGVWQLASQYRLFSATCHTTDDRPCSTVRVLTMVDAPGPLLWCYLWTNLSSTPTVVTALAPEFIDYQGHTNRLQPYLVTCPVPQHLNTPLMGVSIGTTLCDNLTNFLQISNREDLAHHQATKNNAIRLNIPDKSSRRQNDTHNTLSSTPPYAVAVCGPALFYYHLDISRQLVEWLEILRSIRVEHVFLYLTKVHPNIEKVLNYYEQKGFVTVTSFSYPSPYIDDPRLRRVWVGVERSSMFGLENIYFTDCILRNRNRFRYLVHLDPDELPMLGIHWSMTHLMRRIVPRLNVKFSNLKLYWRTFHVNTPPSRQAAALPSHMFFLRHDRYQRRCQRDDECGQYKTIYDTRHTIAAYSHRALLCVGKCVSRAISSRVATLGHFRRHCSVNCEENDFLEDHSLSQHARRAITAVNETLHNIGV